VPLYERALGVFEKALGPDNPDVATCLGHLGQLHMSAGAHDRARPLFERSLAILEKTLGPEHQLVSSPLVALTMVALAEGRPGEAVPLAERAVRLAEKGRVGTYVAQTRFLLALALWDAPAENGRDRARAMALAEQAREGLRGAGEATATQLAQIDAWLREQGARAPAERNGEPSALP
jgi:tetratricopeptide (TPR) repeat protein